MPKRSKAREIVLQLLYQDDLNPQTNPAEGDALIERTLEREPLIVFAKEILSGIRQHRSELSKLLEEAAENWTLERMAVTDRNVLRIATYEILYHDTPTPVAINEAIELARQYGSEESARFVNGILDKVARRIEEKKDGECRGT